MALINCPECLKKISDSAEYCPSCGLPINPSKTFKPKGAGCFMQTLNAGCLIVAIIILIAFVLAGITAYKLKSEKAEKKTEIKSIEKK